MFYDTRLNNHNFKYNPFKACIVPRPIAWIGTLNEDKSTNLAPYSYFNGVSDIPPIIMFASGFKTNGEKKDSIINIERDHEFTVNIANYDLSDMLNKSSQPLDYGISEPETFGIEMSTSKLITPPRVKLAPITLECVYLKTIDLEADNKKCSAQAVFGHVIGINIDDSVITDGRVDTTKLKPIARLGYNEYTVIEKIFTMDRSK